MSFKYLSQSFAAFSVARYSQIAVVTRKTFSWVLTRTIKGTDMLFENNRKIALQNFLDGVGNISTYEVIAPVLADQGWDIHPVFYDSKIVGAIVEKDGEIHTSIAPDYQKLWNPRPYIKSILYPALKKYGVIYSDAEKGDFKSIKWLEKLGFKYLKEGDGRIFYSLKSDGFKKWE